VKSCRGLAALALPALLASGQAPKNNPPSPPPKSIVFLGTSLTAGYGLSPEQAFPALIGARMAQEHLPYSVVNAGVSGETSAGALRRLDWVLREPAAILVVETGANDGLRGQDPKATQANIQAILDRARRASPPPRILLLGMRALPNLGPDYTERFDALYPALARANKLAFLPFLLEGVGGVAALNQADGIHPNVEGEKVVAANVWKALRPLLAP
jgi:acyl-CoA thioesterase-1